MSDIEARIDRLEAIHAIEQLAMRYALAVDGRDVDAWVALFVEDVDCGRHGRGRLALHEVIEPQLRGFYRSIHQICGHRISLLGPDAAEGVVYCRAEHEVGSRWMVMAVAYFDEYARRGDDWYFVRRREKHWYSVDVLDRPAPPFHRWPDGGAERLPGDLTGWRDFWEGTDVSALTNAPVEQGNG